MVMIAVTVIILFSKWTGASSVPFPKPSTAPHAPAAAVSAAAPTASLLKEAREYNDAPAPNSIVGLMQTTHALALVQAAGGHAQFTHELREKQRQCIAHIAATYPEVLHT